MTTGRNVAVFGATSAIAHETCKLLAERGDSICCIARNQGKLNTILNDLQVRAKNPKKVFSICSDLDDISNHENLIQEVVNLTGKIDLVIIAHGALPDQNHCEKSHSHAIKNIHTNGISYISLLTIIANYMKERHEGTIAAITSVAADRGRKSNYVYGAGKGLTSIFLQGLQNRLHEEGVSVLNIKPGMIDTPMTAQHEKGLLWSTPQQVAKDIVSAIDRNSGTIYSPWYWRYIMLGIRSIPDFIFKRMSL